ncbi:MAG: high-affinity branched-chain amino acid ABC transporter ATP-binding protein LivG, partial [Treponema sp.]|nr:high-affinity branched-chain amino acid ABC transporter ATP-binding protein LivG [Treponema sp.]
FGITIWMIEHQMQVVNTLAQNIKVINFGKELAEGTPEEIQKNPAVIDAYLGNSDINIKDAYPGLPEKRKKEA